MTEPPPASATYNYRIKYFIVDELGTLMWTGSMAISWEKPRPTDPARLAVFDLVTTKTIRRSCDDVGAPAGRVLIAAVRQID